MIFLAESATFSSGTPVMLLRKRFQKERKEKNNISPCLLGTCDLVPPFGAGGQRERGGGG